ncbi:hypothetical protein SAY86_023486 [Trapa natans]|uniref:CASP-like protein n=1 Tax=Trapa natans TaxID=22666 RepID=A0AAN7RA92_TRANT|nr:hypothetical protein SAY86_023486 [Trapa natans]
MMRSDDHSATIDVPHVESKAVIKGKASLLPAAAAVAARPVGGWKKGVAIFDFVFRVSAMVAAVAAAAAMGTSDQTLPFFTQFFQFEASYDDLPTFQYVSSVFKKQRRCISESSDNFKIEMRDDMLLSSIVVKIRTHNVNNSIICRFFVIAMAIVASYLLLSLPLSIVTIVRRFAAGPRILLLFLDTVALTLTTAAGASGAAIVYLAHNGNQSTNWLAICQQFGDFCQKVSGAVVGSFIAAVLILFLVALSAMALRRV